MKVLVLGGGGREHALAWKIIQSPQCEALYLHPGNAGTIRMGFRPLGEIKSDTPQTVSKRAKELGISLVVIGPEAYLDAGYGDALRKDGFLVVGPNRSAARLETSKVFSKEFMKRADVPTANFSVVASADELMAVEHKRWPVVLKLDGLAAGKGVVIAQSANDVEDFAKRIWTEGEFGPGPHKVLVEDFIGGRELSYIGLCDGTKFVPLASATDFKRLGDGDEGPNTGGMGVVSPSPFFSIGLQRVIEKEIVERVLHQLQAEKLQYRGALYIGVMITPDGKPFVLEFNARFGDPETQAVLPRLKTDFLSLLLLTAEGRLAEAPTLEWDARHSVYVVGAAANYPGKPQVGDAIGGWEEIREGSALFFSGVREIESHLVTAGGRVLGVGALGATLDDARKNAYEELRKVTWKGMQYRTDIGVWKS